MEHTKGVTSSDQITPAEPVAAGTNSGPSSDGSDGAASGDGSNFVRRSTERPIRPRSVQDWNHQPPTEKQLRYIEMLGGEPTGVKTKRDASDRIDELRRARGRSWPLDPARLAQRGAQAAANTSGEWESAHHSLLASVRLDLQEYVDRLLGKLRSRTSDFLGTDGSSNRHGPDDMVRRATREIEELTLCRRYGQPPRGQLAGSINDDKPKPTLNVRSAASVEDSKSGRRRLTERWIPWLGLVIVFLSLVMIEAGTNTALLMDGVEGSGIQAFVLAVIVSFVNVGGLGISLGALLYWLSRILDPARRALILLPCGVIWAACTFLFNLVVGRHRQVFARRVALIEEQNVALESSLNTPAATIATVSELLADTPYNPLAWGLEALLFAVLGIMLCALGLAKGVTFARGRADGAMGETMSTPASAEDDDIVDQPTYEFVDQPTYELLFDAFVTLPERYHRMLTTILREDVANSFRDLDRERREVGTQIEMLSDERIRRACIHCAEHAFILAHNREHPNKIDLVSIEANRRDKYSEPLPVPAADLGVLEDATNLVDEWKKTGQAEFAARIDAACREIMVVWGNHKSVILGTPSPSRVRNRSMVGDGE